MTNQKTLPATAAAAISASALLTCPALAQASPMIPLAPVQRRRNLRLCAQSLKIAGVDRDKTCPRDTRRQ